MTDDERFEGAEGRDEELREGCKWGEEPDFTSSPEEGLRVHLEELSAEERAIAISYHRPGIQGRIDLIRAELVRCDGDSLSPDEELARVLLQEGRRGGGVS
jgi:hypothetical protein